jgi:hypothetical protein
VRRNQTSLFSELAAMRLFNERGATNFSFIPSGRRRPTRRPELECMESRALLSSMPMHPQVPLIGHAQVANSTVHLDDSISIGGGVLSGKLVASAPVIKGTILKTFTYSIHITQGTITFPVTTPLTGKFKDWVLTYKGDGTPTIGHVTKLELGPLKMEGTSGKDKGSLSFTFKPSKESNLFFPQSTYHYEMVKEGGFTKLDITKPALSQFALVSFLGAEFLPVAPSMNSTLVAFDTNMVVNFGHIGGL